jgi:hypothetical protein
MKRSHCDDAAIIARHSQLVYLVLPNAFSTSIADVPTLATTAFSRSGVMRHLLHQPTTSWGLFTFTWARSQVVSFLTVAAMLRSPMAHVSGRLDLMTEGT